MKHFAITLLLAALMVVPTFAEASETLPECPRGKEWKDKIKAEKIAFFTSELQLTPQEAEKFWPIYNQTTQERDRYHHQARQDMKALNAAIEHNASEAQIKQLLDKYIQSADQCDNMRNRVYEEVSKVLPAIKTAKLFIAEEKFMLRQFRALKKDNKEE